MCGQPTAYNTYATLPYTNPLFMGFSRSQNVNKEIIIYHFRYIKNPQKSNAFVGSFFRTFEIQIRRNKRYGDIIVEAVDQIR